MGIRDNAPFEQSEEKFARLERLLKVSLNMFEIILLPGYSDNYKDKFDLFTCSQVYKGKRKGGALSLCILDDQNLPEATPKHFMYIMDLSNFKHRMTRQNDVKINNCARNAKCRFCDFFRSCKPFTLTKYKHTEISSTSVISASSREKRRVCDSQINDSRCQLQSSCMPTSNQPLMTRTDTSPSYCPLWSCLVSLQSKLNSKCFIHHMRKRGTFAPSWNTCFNCK